MEPLHVKAMFGLKDEVLTSELLNELNENGETVWHVAAEFGSLRHVPESLFTADVLHKTDKYGKTVLTVAAASELKYIPKHLFNKDILNKQGKYGNSIWHIAAQYNTLKEIPVHFLTSEALSQKKTNGDTVWHIAAEFGTLRDIPKSLFSTESLVQMGYSHTVWELIAQYRLIKDVPEHLISKELFENFVPEDRAYIDNVVSNRLDRLNIFLKHNPSFFKDLEFKDPRLVFLEVNESLVFKFIGIDDKVILNKNGVAVGKKNLDSIKSAVSFIEQTYPHIEQSISLPNNSLTVQSFVL